MRAVYLTRGAHLVMATFLAASAIVMADDRGMFGEQQTLASTAETIREVGAGELPIGFDDLGDIKDGAARIADAFDEVGRALE